MAERPARFLSIEDTATILRVLADPRRYDIVRELGAADGPVACCMLAQAGQVAAPTMSHHLHQLELCGLIAVSRDGKFAVLRLVRARYEAFIRQLAADAWLASPDRPSSAEPAEDALNTVRPAHNSTAVEPTRTR